MSSRLWLALGAGGVGLVLACGGGPTEPPGSGPTGDGPSADGGSTTAEAPPPTVVDEAPPADAIFLQALRPTSGDARGLLDGSAPWKPSATDAVDEGVLLRFEEDTAVGELTLVPCDGSDFNVDYYVNGNNLMLARLAGSQTRNIERATDGAPVRSLFIRVTAVHEGSACLASMSMTAGGKAIDVRPPRAVSGKVSATSVLDPADAYHPSYLFDGRVDFGWVEGEDDLGEGQSVTVTLDQEVEIHAIELWNGYQRSQDHFDKNGRLAKFTVALDGGAKHQLEAKDIMGRQKIALSSPAKTRTLTLTVDTGKEGTRYKDLVISELRVWDKHGPITVATPDRKERADALRKEVGSSSLVDVMDRTWRGHCERGESDQRTLKVREDHSFVIYESLSDFDVSHKEVFDGAWVAGKTSTGWSEVKLYGRRHRIDNEFVPYGESKSSSSTRIGGGTLSIVPAKALSKEELEGELGGWRDDIPGKVECIYEDGGDDVHKYLSDNGAILVKGKAYTDVLFPGT